jgi:2-polyprenyl-6-methoxyphenol hydroxylase-like FAD-dependent oxidoreductase
VAAGVSKAADDAAALTQALADHDNVEAALRRYEAERLPENHRIIARARHLGAYLQATQSAEERARSARHGIPEAVLAETAVLDFLHG